MAERRMFAKTVIDSDSFLDMPLSTQALYFHLSMRADDDGFVNNPKKVQRMIGASGDDLKILAAKQFIIPFESGIVVIKHWKIHNYIQGDRYKATVYTEEKSRLTQKQNHEYELEMPCNQDVSILDTECIQDVSILDTQVRLGKDSIGKDSIETICPEPKAPDRHPFITLPLNDGTEYPVTIEAMEECRRLYPAVDIEQELRNMRGWCISNPTKRKTRRGIDKFIHAWLSKEQDKGPRRQQAKKPHQQMMTSDIDVSDLEKKLRAN